MKTKKSFNFFTVLGHVPRPDFLSTIHKEKPMGPVWGTWFFWNTIVAILVTLIGAYFLTQGAQKLESDLWPQVPEFNFVFEDHKLISTNLEEPFRLDLNENNNEEDLTFLIDLEGENYDIESIKVLDNVALVDQNGIFIQEAHRPKIEKILFKKFPSLENTVFNKADLKEVLSNIGPMVLFYISLILFIFVWGFYNILRILEVLLLSVVFLILGMISKAKNVTFGEYLITTLGLSFIPLLVGTGLLLVGIISLSFILALYLILFSMNIYHILKSPDKKS